jgi:ribonuclease P protein component
LAILSPPVVLPVRADFLRMAARGQKFARPGFVLQAMVTEPGTPLRIGYTATKKIGNAVARSRARRRLREAARLTLGRRALTGLELVLICRQDTHKRPFAELCAELDRAVQSVRA